MDIFSNRYGLQRVIQKIATDKLLIMGDSQLTRYRKTKRGNITSIDFDGGPSFSVGNVIYYKNLKWLITSINPIQSRYDDFLEVVFDVIMQFPDRHN